MLTLSKDENKKKLHEMADMFKINPNPLSCRGNFKQFNATYLSLSLSSSPNPQMHLNLKAKSLILFFSSSFVRIHRV